MDDIKIPRIDPDINPTPQFWEAVKYLLLNNITTLDELSRIWRKTIIEINRMMVDEETVPDDLIDNIIIRFHVSPIFIYQNQKPIIVDDLHSGRQSN